MINMLKDRFERRFTYLRLSITDVCNFRCNYCLPDGYCSGDAKPSPLSLTEIKKVVAAFAINGTKKIRITGGEPSLRKDLPEIIRACKQTTGIETVALTSNGYRVTHCLPLWKDAGLDHLNLSADSLDPQQFKLITGHDKVGEVLAGIEQALALKLAKVKLNVVLMREHNSNELTQFLEYVRNRPISLRFIELMQTGDNHAFFKAQHVSGSGIKATLEEQGWLQVLREPHSGPAIEYTHNDYTGNIGLIMPYSKDFCSSCNRLRVSSEGNLHLCLFADGYRSLRPYLKNDSVEQLASRLREWVMDKKETHLLEDGNSGSTRHLAMIGG